MPSRAALWVVLIAALSGCGGVISKEVRSQATPLGDYAELREEPERFRGQTVIVGGEIIETRNKAAETRLVILEKPLGSDERPADSDVSGGRFMVRFARYLDPVVYQKGRKVTVAGSVVGTETEKVGEAPYTYVVLEGREVHLWRAPERMAAPYYYDPWFPWWHDPFLRHRFFW
ncbi:MAG: Slp family lipoprotein [Deltaproteobacteria bacterium]|nr:Slp family lipoprotein [Deltaproteobacteria bacterium]